MDPAPFWELEEVREAVEQVASSEEITIIVGAGAVAEAGLPTWADLVHALLENCGRELLSRSGCSAEDDIDELARQFSKWTLEADRETGAGAIVRAVLSEARFEELLVDALYAGVGDAPLPGPTVSGVARLKEIWGERCEIVTTNYDTLIEAALVEVAGVRAEDVKYVVDPDEHPGVWVVRHLHGIRTRDLKLGALVFSEADYHQMQGSRDAWQERFMEDRLASSTCLFVGAGMSDPNLLRYLYRSGTEDCRHAAVIVNQHDPWRTRGLSQALLRARSTAAKERWKRAGVMAIEADYSVQSAQFVHEVALRRSRGSAYVPYAERLREWEAEMDAGFLSRDEQDFVDGQNALQPELRGWLDDVVRVLESEEPVDPHERLALQLWVRDPSEHALVLWGASDRAWRDPRTLSFERIRRPAARLAVEAFCLGNPVGVDLDEADTRWNFISAIPIYIDQSERFGRLPVGVVTMTSTFGAGVSVLDLSRGDSAERGRRAEVWDWVQQFVTPIAAALLNPEEPNQPTDQDGTVAVPLVTGG